jgi:hypothetical protein
MLLTWIGGRPIETPYDSLGQLFTLLYFIYFLVVPLISYMWDQIIK